jgi:tetratricopeptide (TPR) repeat protein
MAHFMTLVGRGLTYPGRAARQRPRAALALGAAAVFCAALAGFGYAWHQRGAARDDLAAGRPAEARQRLDLWLTVWSQDEEGHLMAARAARLCGDRDAAEAHLNRSLKLHGGATEAVQLEFLLLRVQRGELDEVAPALIECVEKGHPESPAILETLGRAYMHALRYKAAHACLTRWLELSPDTARAYQWRGWVLERMNKPSAAAEDYSRALELDPDLAPVRLRLAEMLLEDNRAPDALPHLERLFRQSPDDPEVQGRLGMCRYEQGRMDEAADLLRKAVRRRPDDQGVLIYLAKIDMDGGRGEAAEGRLRKVLRADPSDTEARFRLVAALRLQGRTEDAAAAQKEYDRYKAWVDRANKLLREVPDSPTAGAADYAEIGELLLRVGRDRLGVYWLNQALERDPAYEPARRALADYYETHPDGEKGDGPAGAP